MMNLAERSWAEDFLSELRHEKRYSPHTLLAYEVDLRQFAAFIATEFQEHNPGLAGYAMIRAWIVALMEQGLNARSVNRKIACLRSFYRFCRKRSLIVIDPTQRIQMLKTASRLPQFITEEDVAALLHPAAEDDSFEALRDRLIIELLYGAGLRKAELIGLKDGSVNLRERTLRVLGKRQKERIVPFPWSLVPRLERYMQRREQEVERKKHGHLLVTAQGNALYPVIVHRITSRRLGAFSYLERKGPHVLRHTYATHLLNNGAPINAVKDLLGHSSLAATQIYTHNSIEKLKKAFDQAHPKA